jgi:uncharacterized membrane protein
MHISITPAELGASYNVGPTLSAELPTPPFRPRAIGRLTFFFGPLAGAFVSAISLRRMGYKEKAGKVIRYTFLISIGVALILGLIPEGLGRIFGLGLEIGFYVIFPKIIYREFEAWQAAHPEIEPSSGWRAIGWALLGIFLYLFVIMLIVFLLSLAVPPPRNG